MIGRAQHVRGYFTLLFFVSKRGSGWPWPHSFPPDEQLYGLIEPFKVLGDSTRIKIRYALLDAELYVCGVARLLNIIPTAASHQLRVLKVRLLVKSCREGKIVFYSLCNDHVRGHPTHGNGTHKRVKDIPYEGSRFK